MLVDSHCHLDFPEFAEDFDGVLTRAAAADVGLMVTICTGISRFDAVRTIAERHGNIYCTVGVHPHQADGEGVDDPAVLIRLAKHGRVVGIGETGLDYFYERSPRDAQRSSFRAHIRAARETGLPVIVHTRDADDDTLAILREEHQDGPFNGLIHCFSTSRQLAEKAINIGFYISFSGIVTFKKADNLREIARDLPLEHILIETDAPYLAPMPHRGKRNEPAFAAHTAACVAEARGMTAEALSNATTENFFRLFTRAERPDA